MNLIKFWYILCIILFVYYVSDVLKLKHKVIYTHSFRQLTDQDFPNVTFCLNLYLTSTRCAQLPLKQAFTCKRISPLGCITKNFHQLTIDQIATKLRQCPLSQARWNLKKVTRKYFYNGHYCFVEVDTNKNFQKDNDSTEFYQNNAINYDAKIYFDHLGRIPIDFTKYALSHNCYLDSHSKFRCIGEQLYLEKVIIKRLAEPYESQCKFNERTREDCLLDCYQAEMKKRNLVDYRLYYELDEKINLNITQLNEDIDDARVIPNITNCNEQCLGEDCVEHYFSVQRNTLLDANKISFYLLNKVRLLEAKPMYTNEYIFVYILGLFGNLFNITVISSLQNLNSFLKIKSKSYLIDKFKLRPETVESKQNFVGDFVIALTFLIGFLACTYQFVNLFHKYRKFEFIQSSFIENPIENERITITVCFNLAGLNSKNQKYLALLKDDLTGIEKNQTLKKFYLNYSLEEINRVTKSIQKIHKRSFVRKGIEFEETLQVSYRSTVFFWKNNKCFPFDVDYSETRIDQLLRQTIYVLVLSTPNSCYFVTPFKQTQNTKDNVFDYKSSTIYHRYEKNLKHPFEDNCTNYNYLNRSRHMNCQNQYQCIEQCVQNEFILNRTSLIDLYFIDYYLYPKELRAKLKILILNQKETKLKNQFLMKCADEFHHKDCKLSRFHHVYRRSFKNKKLINIPLYIMKQSTIKTAKYKDLNVFYHLINVISMWLCVSMPVLIKLPMQLLINQSAIKKLIQLKWSNVKIVLNFIFIIILIYKISLIRNEIQKNQMKLIANSKLVTKIKLPKLSICINYKTYLEHFDPSFNESFKVDGHTGIELESMTENVSSIISSIELLDEHFNLIKLTKDDLDKNLGGMRSALWLYGIYFEDLKCFEFVFNFIYLSKFMPSFFKSQLLKITFTANHKVIYIILSTINELNLNQKMLLNDESLTILYFSEVSIKIIDDLFYIRNPLKLLSDRNLKDDNRFFESLRMRFAQLHNSSTTIIPLIKEYLHLKINNSLFKQFYHRFYALNSQDERIKHRFLTNFLVRKTSYNYNKTVLIIKPTRFDSRLTYVNEFNFSELFFFFLSETFVWLNMTFIDIPYFVRNAFAFLRNYLKRKFDFRYYRRIQN